MSIIPDPSGSTSERAAASPTPATAGTTTLTSPPATRPSTRGERPEGRGRNGWALLVRLHFYAGVLVAPFLAVAALTGLAYAFTPQLDRLVYSDQLTVANVTGTPRSLAAQVEAARTVQPEGTLAKVITPDAPDATTRVVFDVEGLGENQRTVYVDPYTGQAKGVLTTWFDSTPLTAWIESCTAASTSATRGGCTRSWPPAGSGSSPVAGCCCGWGEPATTAETGRPGPPWYRTAPPAACAVPGACTPASVHGSSSASCSSAPPD